MKVTLRHSSGQQRDAQLRGGERQKICSRFCLSGLRQIKWVEFTVGLPFYNNKEFTVTALDRHFALQLLPHETPPSQKREECLRLH